MSHAFCIMAGFLAAHAYNDTSEGRAVFAFLGAGVCLVAAGILSVKFGA